MKSKIMSTLAVAALTIALAIPIALPAQPQATGGGQGNPPAAGGQKASRMGQQEGRERHPEIREAIRQLRRAKETLTRDAARDFGGHRAKAAQLVDEAIEQCQQALAADKK